MTFSPDTLLTIAGFLVAGGAAYGGARSALNGTRKEVKEIKQSLVDHIKADENLAREMIDRLARIETKLEVE
jgi:hypothetical protein